LRGYSEPGTAQPKSRIPERFAGRLPVDTVTAGRVTSGVRLELRGTASSVGLGFTVESPAERGAPTMGAAFSVWTRSGLHWQVPIGQEDTAADIPLPTREADETVLVYLPEALVVHIDSVSWDAGTLTSAPRGPSWAVYGDSITQGWSATDPGAAWPSIAGRELGLDVINLGFAGAARGELPSAAQIAEAPADLITLAWGTNCWSTIPYDAGLMEQLSRLFLTTVRQGHPDAEILVVSPIVRPAAERTPNVYGATLEDLRAALESSVDSYVKSHHDDKLHLLRGRELLDERLLVDGIHPGDEGHAQLAGAVVAELSESVAFIGESGRRSATAP
jgi:lysophospholipase L1-like esterase